MQPYGQYCPVARAAELLGDRWTLLIVRELLFGPLRFTEIERGLPGISRSVLAQRLRRLQHDRIIEAVPEHTGGGYRFTVAGEELRPVLQTLGDWVSRWLMADPTPAECDPELLTLWISRRVNTEALPGRRVVVEFRYHGERPLWAWLVLEPGDISVCLHDPCLPVDLTVRGHLEICIGSTAAAAHWPPRSPPSASNWTACRRCGARSHPGWLGVPSPQPCGKPWCP